MEMIFGHTFGSTIDFCSSQKSPYDFAHINRFSQASWPSHSIWRCRGLGPVKSDCGSIMTGINFDGSIKARVVNTLGLPLVGEPIAIGQNSRGHGTYGARGPGRRAPTPASLSASSLALFPA